MGVLRVVVLSWMWEDKGVERVLLGLGDGCRCECWYLLFEGWLIVVVDWGDWYGGVGWFLEFVVLDVVLVVWVGV